MPAILYVRITSRLAQGEVDQRLHARSSRFQEVPGLLQKFYGRDDATGDVCGIYCFETAAALDAFRDSELARSIADAYEADTVRREVYDVLFSLRPEAGPFPPHSA